MRCAGPHRLRNTLASLHAFLRLRLRAQMTRRRTGSCTFVRAGVSSEDARCQQRARVQCRHGSARLVREPFAFGRVVYRVWSNAKFECQHSADAVQQLREAVAVSQVRQSWATWFNVESENSSLESRMSGCRFRSP
jgi:hypothetical protein